MAESQVTSGAVLAAVVLTFGLAALARWLRSRARRRGSRPRRPYAIEPSTASGRRRAPPKPPWVAREVIRLKALLPDHGCRKIAVTFNRLFQSQGGMRVGKTFVADVIRRSQNEIVRKRRELKHRIPRRLPRNLIWALDLTWLPTPGEPALVAGLIDHGSRACLTLAPLRRRTAAALLRLVLDATERFGRPRTLRTDNEPAFGSVLFRLGLRLLGIRHRRTRPFAPWENGRIERFFGTLKEQVKSAQGEIGDPSAALLEFRAWYNHLRPHHHLAGRTPAEAWNRSAPRPAGRMRLYEAWGGALRGFY